MIRKALPLLTLVWCVQEFADSVQALLFISHLPQERMIEAKLYPSQKDDGARVYFRADLPAKYKQIENGNFVIYGRHFDEFKPVYTEEYESKKGKIKGVISQLYPKK